MSLPQLAFAALGGFLAHRRCVLGITAILAGPLVGASFAWLGIALGKMYAADVGVYTVLGADDRCGSFDDLVGRARYPHLA
jgi:hypothetical protein